VLPGRPGLSRFEAQMLRYENPLFGFRQKAS
jgi:hypothetical protein